MLEYVFDVVGIAIIAYLLYLAHKKLEE